MSTGFPRALPEAGMNSAVSAFVGTNFNRAHGRLMRRNAFYFFRSAGTTSTGQGAAFSTPAVTLPTSNS